MSVSKNKNKNKQQQNGDFFFEKYMMKKDAGVQGLSHFVYGIILWGSADGVDYVSISCAAEDSCSVKCQ